MATCKIEKRKWHCTANCFFLGRYTVKSGRGEKVSERLLSTFSVLYSEDRSSRVVRNVDSFHCIHNVISLSTVLFMYIRIYNYLLFIYSSNNLRVYTISKQLLHKQVSVLWTWIKYYKQRRFRNICMYNTCPWTWLTTIWKGGVFCCRRAGNIYVSFTK